MNYRERQERNEQIDKRIVALQEEKEQLEREQREREIRNQKNVRVWTFLAKKHEASPSLFVLALLSPCLGSGSNSYGLPEGYQGRGAFSVQAIKDIIRGLEELIEEE